MSNFPIKPTVAALAGLLTFATAHAADVDFGLDKGLEIKGKNFEWDFGSRVQADSAWFDDNASPSPFDDNADLRRARINTKLTIVDDWRVAAEYDVAGINTGWKSVYLQYRGLEHWRFTAGNQVAPFGLAELESSDEDPFMEQSIATAMNPSLLMGIAANTWGNGWTLSGGYFANELSNESQRKSEGEGGVMRLTVSPIEAKGKLLHFGVAGEYRQPNDNDVLRIRTRPESYMTDVRLVSTGNIANVDDTVLLGFEAAAIAGPLTVQAEYMQMSVSRSIGSDLDFTSWYATAGVFLTGETRDYSESRGVIGGPRHIEHRWGAIEVAVRYGTLDLEDQDVTGGQEDNFGFALNWYVNNNVRFMLNYIDFDASPTSAGIDEDGNIISVRAQFVL